MYVNEVMNQALKSVRPPEPKPKRSLDDLMTALESMESIFDDIGEFTPEMIRDHFDAYTSVDEKTDRLIGFMDTQKHGASRAAQWSELWKVKEKKHLSALERTKEYCKWLLQKHPNLEYRGKHAKIVLQRVAPKLTITTPQHRFSSERVIPADHVSVMPPEFVRMEVIYLYDTDAIREALVKGSDTPIARLDENYSVRIKL